MVLLSRSCVLRNIFKLNGNRLCTVACKGSENLSHDQQYSADSSKNVAFYSFPLIKYVGLIGKIKNYQAIFTLVSIPITGCLMYSDFLHNDYFLAVCGIGFSGTVTLSLTAFYLKNLIGFLYLNEKQDMVRISYVDFWGKRRNTEIPVNDFVPIPDLPRAVTDRVYLTLRRYSNKDTYKINLSHGRIIDQVQFDHAFGKSDMI